MGKIVLVGLILLSSRFLEQSSGEPVLLLPINLNGDAGSYESIYEVTIDNAANPVTQFSLCLWVNPFRFRGSCRILQLFCSCCDEDNYIYDVRMENEFLTVGGFDNEDVKLEAYAWQHLCLLYGENVYIYFNEMSYEIASKELIKPPNIRNLIEVYVGGDNYVDLSFSGLIADVRFYWEILEPSKIHEISRFSMNSSGKYKMLLPSLENLSEYIHTNEYIKASYEQDERDETSNPNFFFDSDKILTDKNDYFVNYFHESVSCETAKDTCDKFGGQIVSFETSADLELLLSYIFKYVLTTNDKVGSFWIEHLSNGSKTCVEGSHKLQSSTIAISSNKTSQRILQKPLCLFSKRQEYYLKTSDMQLVLHHIPNTLFVFEDLKRDLRLSKEDMKIKLWNIFSNQVYAESAMESCTNSFIGRKNWRIHVTNNFENVIFSTCTLGEFTCTSGLCISIDKLCNFERDCADASDEEFCGVGISPSRSYDKRLAPAPSKDEGVKINLRLILERVVEIEMKENIIDLSFKVNVGWRDPRLKFKNLPKNKSITVEPDFYEKIWQPRISILEAIDVDRKAFYLDTNFGKLFAVQTEEGSIKIVEGYEVIVYNGENVQLTAKQRKTVKINCKIDLFLYPFDEQICTFTLAVRGLVYRDVEWSEDRTITIRPGEEQMTLYSDLKFYFDAPLTPHKRNLRISLKFTRKYGAYLFNTFLPCIILKVIGLLSFLMPTDDYLDRLSVTLSCLIVMAAIFTQVSSSLPPSADPKLIDIWMFSHIALLFLVFIVHIIVIFLHHKYSNKHHGNNQQSSKVTNLYPEHEDYQDISLPSNLFAMRRKVTTPSTVPAADAWNMKRVALKDDKKKPVPCYVKANTAGKVICVCCYIAYLSIFFAEVKQQHKEHMNA